MVLLQLCRWKFSHKKLCSSLFTKMTNLLFEQPLGRIRGNIWTSPTACWKARGRLPIRYNRTFFAFGGGSVTFIAIFTWKGTLLPNRCWYQKTRVFLLPQSEDGMILSSFLWARGMKIHHAV